MKEKELDKIRGKLLKEFECFWECRKTLNKYSQNKEYEDFDYVIEKIDMIIYNLEELQEIIEITINEKEEY